MKYNIILKYKAEDFRRITGVKLDTFTKMVEILTSAYAIKHKRRGRNSKLSIEEMLLAALEYWREYRTYAHIGASYDLDESNIYRTIKWVENVLIKSGLFTLPGKKALLKSDAEYEIILIDATESPIERPKKDNADIIQARKSATP